MAAATTRALELERPAEGGIFPSTRQFIPETETSLASSKTPLRPHKK